MAPRLASLQKTLFGAWEAVQVELHGQYSIRRFHNLRRYTDSTSTRQAIIVLLLTPLPCLCVLIGIDALPMVSPEEGAYKQTTGFWVRTLCSGWGFAFLLNVQLCQIEPSLPMSTRRLWMISISVGLVLVATYQLEVWVIGFPVPFTLQIQSIPFTIALGAACLFSWKGFFDTHPVAKDNVICYLKSFNTSNLAVASYIAYILVYMQLDGWYQVALASLLPVMKLVGKNVMSAGLYHQEDLAPVIMTTIVDVFHTLFVSMTMQQTSTSITTTSLFVAIDFIQSAIATYDVRQILTRLKELNDQIERLHREKLPSDSGGLFFNVARLLETSETVRRHPAIALPRHLRNPVQPRVRLCNRVLSPTRPKLVAVQPIGPTCPSLATSIPPMNELESARVEYAQKALKLLHMTECYVLLEFVEAMVPTIYGWSHLSIEVSRDSGFLVLTMA